VPGAAVGVVLAVASTPCRVLITAEPGSGCAAALVGVSPEATRAASRLARVKGASRGPEVRAVGGAEVRMGVRWES
jgi:hypothetical protein